MKPLNILHLSDFHYHGSFDQRLIIDALKADLSHLCSGPRKPDLVIFSGDLVRAADDEDIYFKLDEELIQPISKLTGCSESRFIICPGNHDIQRTSIEKNKSLHEAFIDGFKTRETLNSSYLAGELQSFIEPKFEKFTEYRDLVCSKASYSDGLVSIYTLPELNLDIVTLNSAWASWAGIDERNDERKLLFPEAAIHGAISKLNPAHRHVLVHHHPFAWLQAFCEQEVIGTIDGKFDIQIFGHMHIAKPQLIKDFKGTTLAHQSGALYTGKRRYNGYGLISYEAEQGFSEINFRTYYEKRREFDEGTDLIKGGVFYPSDASKKFWHDLRKQVDVPALQEWVRAELLPAARETYNEGLADRPVCDLFVPPPMYVTAQVKEIDDKTKLEKQEEIVSFDELLSSNTNWIIRGGQEFGKTTLLRQLALGLMQDTSDGKNSSVPVYVEFSEVRPGKLERIIKNALLADLTCCPLSQLLGGGYVTVLIDDVDFSSPLMSVLYSFVERYPHNRFILSTANRDETTAIFGEGEFVNISSNAPVVFNNVSLRPFTRKKMRAFVEKWNGEQNARTDEVLNQLTSEFRNMNIPVTAANGTILMSILEERSAFTPINRATLIERFVEHLLEKPSLKEAQRQTFDFVNKIHLLAHVAEFMARSNTYILEEKQLTDLVRHYLDQIGLTQDPPAIVDIFIKSRILALRPIGRISFRYRAFLEFFVAKQMSFDPNFKAWVTDEERYLSYLNEIQYYAGLDRSDVTLLEAIATRFDLLNKEIEREASWVFDIEKISTFQPPGIDSDEDLLAEFQKQMDGAPLTPDERDEVLEAELPQDSERRQEVFRPKITGPQKWIVCLFLYSGVLKNLEIIPDAVKRIHLAAVLNAWGVLTLQSLAVVPTLAKQRKVKVNGILYEVNMPRHFSESKVARLIYIELPNSVSRLLNIILGTEKLDRQLVEPALIELDEPLITKFFRTTLITDLRLRDWPSALEKGVAEFAESPYLTEALARKLFDTYYMGTYSKDLEPRLRTAFAGLISAIKGGTKKQQQKVKGQQMQVIERNALLRKLRVSSQE